jgi:hypothetical protein
MTMKGEDARIIETAGPVAAGDVLPPSPPESVPNPL